MKSNQPTTIKPGIWPAIACAVISTLMFTANNENEAAKFIAGSMFAGTSLVFLSIAKDSHKNGTPWE